MKNTKTMTRKPVTRKPITDDPMEAMMEALENCANVVAEVQAQNIKLESRVYTLECELAALSIATPEATPVKQTPARVKIPAMFATAPKVSSPVKSKAPKAPANDDLLTRCVNAAKANIRKGLYSEKVTIMYPGDIRCFLTVGLRKEIKAHREANGIRLEAFSRTLSNAYHEQTGIDPVTLF